MKTNFKHFFNLLWGMTDKEFRVRYKNTLFGFLWIVINPLLQMFVIGFIFRFFIKDPIPNYYLYLLTGLLVWNFFSLSISKTTPLIVNERTLIKKAKFPKEVLPLSVILSNFIHLLIAFALLIIPVVYIGAFNISNILSLFEGLILLITFTIGFGMLTAALDVRFRDINFFVQAMLIIWFYATPIVYSINVVPYRLMWIWRINPMTSITQLLQNFFISAPGPGIGMLISNISIIFVISIVGIIVFKSESKNFDDWV